MCHSLFNSLFLTFYHTCCVLLLSLSVCVCVCVCVCVYAVLWFIAQSCPTLGNLMDCSPPGSSVHGDSPGKNTGVGSLSLL